MLNFLPYDLLRAFYDKQHRWSRWGKGVLVSFPKSGNTWLRFILSNLLLNGDTAEQADFHTIDKLFPDARVYSDGAALIKSHSPRYLMSQKGELKVIVVFRNPLDVFPSYFDYMVNEHGLADVSFDQFIGSSRYGIRAWQKFHASWWNYEEALFIDYDHLVEHTENTVQKVIDHLGPSNFKNLSIRDAMERSSRGEMHRVKTESGDPYSNNPDYDFSNVHKKTRFKMNATQTELISNRLFGIYKKLLLR